MAQLSRSTRPCRAPGSRRRWAPSRPRSGSSSDSPRGTAEARRARAELREQSRGTPRGPRSTRTATPRRRSCRSPRARRAPARRRASTASVVARPRGRRRAAWSSRPLRVLLVRHAAVVAHPGLVHGVVPARHEAVDLVVRARRRRCCSRASTGCRRSSTSSVNQTRILKRKSRVVSAPTGQMSATFIEYGLSSSRAREQLEQRLVAAVEHAELAGLGHLAAEAHAAPAQDAALLVEHDRRPEVDGLLRGPARLARARRRSRRTRTRSPAACTRRPGRRSGSRAGG